MIGVTAVVIVILLVNSGNVISYEKNIEETVMFSEEYSREDSDRAYANIDEFVGRLKDYYPDGDKLQLYDTCDQQIGGGENGIDSVIYIAVYTNTQNQALSVYADSTGEIYYAECNFTW